MIDAARRRYIRGMIWLMLTGACTQDITGGGHPPPKSAIDFVDVYPTGYSLVVADTVRLLAAAYDRQCDFEFCTDVPVGAIFHWHTTDTNVARVSDGLVRAVGRGVTYVVVEAAGLRDSARIRVGTAYVPLARIAPGGRCALTASGAAYCWGDLYFNSPDEDLGLYMAPRLVAGGLTFSAISAGSAAACGIGPGDQGYCWGSGYLGAAPDFTGNPLATAAPGVFRSIAAGERTLGAGYSSNTHSCGIATNGVAYCWGANDLGQLGTDIGLATCNTGEIGHDYGCTQTPVPVTGGLTFTSVQAGGTHTCALTADSLAYCWGSNAWGELGDSAGTFRSTPGVVANAPRLATLTTGLRHSCGLTNDGSAYCWGENTAGQLGIGAVDSSRHPEPSPVVGSLVFTAIDAGQRTCALTADGQVYCWGGGMAVPTLVGGGVTFSSVGVDPSGMACGIATDARGYCWFGNGFPAPLIGPIEP